MPAKKAPTRLPFEPEHKISSWKCVDPEGLTQGFLLPEFTIMALARLGPPGAIGSRESGIFLFRPFEYDDNGNHRLRIYYDTKIYPFGPFIDKEI